ncbi:6-phosphofructokinase [Tuwongella immobilis]|uniref:6-phosphofructokinase n=1 Tax=Tuwongella immobilis TaxID=692036 RepID=A0A6C2YRT3_9BACT|nr:6-phosphofructokinase [Tuwongella immobilis]VIP04186.1 6-phosphofructokinase : 6-phosphofructokinase OS=Singulisphaera acidiphila (strain ATCC BAA-1392 / DSM 18658 / VKM B-2454 / MOB10) GN=Sinac_7072 PE=4 SV=1: PFK: PFK: PFK [Tuwongella immobilis]VTS05736.1 6-phosphofructokinase : 6-phosphofructokinase OS=Singulisphaera acidiphila (strain ATCC BAA-1392 / DSM 18658 / VKM B-2454 / MOB10) GN=Sinac_7072 PE=4 SV=1: PFK: PFK: PFK [Tuwongella immobilis]
MKRIGILTAGGDTPALNATIHGAVTRANQRRVEVVGFIKGFSSLFNPRVPHVVLNPLYTTIPELDPTCGGTLIGASRDYVDADDHESIALIADRLKQLRIDGLICIGGDGTLNGMQALSESLPTVLAPKTIDNDLGLNYPSEPNEWQRVPMEQSHPGLVEKDSEVVDPEGPFQYVRKTSQRSFDLEQMVNYVTPGYATSVYVSASGVQRIRTTAESHRRIAIVEVMGRHSGYIALGSAFGQPDLMLVPEHRMNLDGLVDRIQEIYDLQKHCVIVCGEGIIDEHGKDLGAEEQSTDPAGNVVLSGASEKLRNLLIAKLGDKYFTSRRRNESAKAAIFTRKIGHTQRGGRPILFDRFYASQLGGHAVDMLLEGFINGVAILNWNREKGFHLGSVQANDFRDRWGLIHARKMHESFYDAKNFRPSQIGIDYLLPIFTNCVGADDVEAIRTGLFNSGNLVRSYHSVNVDINKRIRFLGA